MAVTTDIPTLTPISEAYDLGFRFLQARRAQNLSWMGLVEQSFRSLAEVQRSVGSAGAPFARLTTANAGLVRETANVYGAATAHLAR